MNINDVFNYFTDGYQLLSHQLQLSLSNFSSTLNLINILDIALVAIIFWWIWTKIRRTVLTKTIPSFMGLLLIILFSKLFGFIALFYVSLILILIILMTSVLLYNQELQRILENTLDGGRQKNKVRPLGHYELGNFVKELTDTVTILAKSKTPSVLVIRTTKPVVGLTENGTSLRTPFNKEFVLDVFSRKSKLSSGAIVVDNSMIVAVGSTLMATTPKNFVFNLTNPALKQAALHWGAIVIITYRNTDNISLLYKDHSYSKLVLSNLERVVKNILISR